MIHCAKPDIYATNPTDPTDPDTISFHATLAWWTPIAMTAEEVAPDLAEDYTQWHRNEGAGLNETQAQKLASILQDAIDTDNAKNWAKGNGQLIPNTGAEIYSIGNCYFSEKILQKFTTFVRTSGGFKIQ